jgi:hypothetical protein
MPKRTIKRPSKRPTLHSWFIYRISGWRAGHIGTVRAPTAEAAIQQAIREYKITDPVEQSKLIAQRRR